MSYTTKEPVKCKCGYIGYIKITENDQPYSTPWASYTLENLNGSIENFDKNAGLTKNTVMRLSCPKCGEKINTDI